MSDQALGQLKRRAFHNALRLHLDSCRLFRHRSYASSAALAVLAYEELGKLLATDRICDAIVSNPGSRDFHLETLSTGGFLTDHVRKQQYAWMDGNRVEFGFEGPTGRMVASGGLESLKQSALYVEWEDGRVLTPERIGHSHAQKVIRLVMSTIDATAPVAYSGLDGFDSERGLQQASADATEARRHFDAAMAGDVEDAR